MKTWKQRTVISIFAIISIIFAFTSCDNGDDKTHTHDYSATWSKNATQHWHECSCGDKKDVADHQWGEWVETTPATYDVDGLETETCICGATDTRPITKFKKEQPFTIGSVDFVFEYNKNDTTSWTKLNAIIQTYANYMVQDPDSDEVIRINDLANRTATGYRIIVDYSNEGKSTGFSATDAQTLTVGNEYLATTSLTRAILRNAFAAMYAKPYPII
jgi:hypothetical protein